MNNLAYSETKHNIYIYIYIYIYIKKTGLESGDCDELVCLLACLIGLICLFVCLVGGLCVSLFNPQDKREGFSFMKPATTRSSVGTTPGQTTVVQKSCSKKLDQQPAPV
jgi:hypothetical protein